MKPKLFTFTELLFRVPFIALFFWIIFRCAIDFDNRYDSLLILFLGATAWESILFILHRLRVVNVTKFWNSPNGDDPLTEDILNEVHKSLQWEDGEIAGIDMLNLEQKVKSILTRGGGN